MDWMSMCIDIQCLLLIITETEKALTRKSRHWTSLQRAGWLGCEACARHHCRMDLRAAKQNGFTTQSSGDGLLPL